MQVGVGILTAGLGTAEDVNIEPSGSTTVPEKVSDGKLPPLHAEVKDVSPWLAVNNELADREASSGIYAAFWYGDANATEDPLVPAPGWTVTEPSLAMVNTDDAELHVPVVGPRPKSVSGEKGGATSALWALAGVQSLG